MGIANVVQIPEVLEILTFLELSDVARTGDSGNESHTWLVSLSPQWVEEHHRQIFELLAG